MRFRIFATIVAVALLALPTAAAANMYAGGQIGTSILSDSDITDPTGTIQASFSPGFSGTGFFGIEVVPNFRVEGELGYSFNSLDEFSDNTGSIPAIGDLTIFSVMANAFYDFALAPKWKLYIGGGVGIATVSLNDVGFEFFGIDIVIADDDDTVFAWQAGGGIEFDINPTVALQLDYRYFDTAELNFTDVVGDAFTAEADRHTIRFGARWKF